MWPAQSFFISIKKGRWGALVLILRIVGGASDQHAACTLQRQLTMGPTASWSVLTPISHPTPPTWTVCFAKILIHNLVLL